VAPPDLVNASVDAPVRTTGPVSQKVEPIRMNVEVVVDEKSDAAWWQSLSAEDKAAMRDAVASLRKSLEEQLAKSDVVSFDPQMKMLSEKEKQRDDGYWLRVELAPWANPGQNGQGWVSLHWTLSQSATGAEVRGVRAGTGLTAAVMMEEVFRAAGMRGALGADMDSGRDQETVSIRGREVPKSFSALELERVLSRTLRDGHRLPVPSVTRTWDK